MLASRSCMGGRSLKAGRSSSHYSTSPQYKSSIADGSSLTTETANGVEAEIAQASRKIPAASNHTATSRS
eukprot:5144725-Prymnesium_polylepis.1